MNCFKVGLALLVANVIGASAADAATYTFDFAASNSAWLSSTSVSSNQSAAVSVLASAGTYDAASHAVATGTARIATTQAGGLGVCNDFRGGRGGRCHDENTLIDGATANDIAMFTFDKLMTITSITFSAFEDFTIAATYERAATTCKRYLPNGSCKTWNCEMRLVTPAQTFADRFDFFSNSGSGLSFDFASQVNNQFDLADRFTSNQFGIGASGQYDAFRIKSITVQDVSLLRQVGPATVPLPAGGLMLLSAVAGLAALRRRGAAVL